MGQNNSKFWQFATVICIAMGFATTFQSCGAEFNALKSSTSFGDVTGLLSLAGNPSDPNRKIEPDTMRTLSRYEMLFAAQDILGLQMDPLENQRSVSLSSIQDTPRDLTQSGLEAPGINFLDEAFLNGRLELANTIAEEATQSQSLMQCPSGHIMSSRFDGCIQAIVERFGRLSFSRPLSVSELGTYESLFRDISQSVPTEMMGQSNALKMDSATAEGLKAVFASILLSPHFLSRPVASEYDTATMKRINRARQISLFISSTVPDETLIQKVESGEIANRAVVANQTNRLLAQNTKRFAFNVLSQWFAVRDMALDLESSELEQSMLRESVMVFEEILKQDLPISALLNPGFTFVDRSLAQHYGFSSTGYSFKKVSTTERGGVLSQGAVLLRTSDGDRTKPVTRGLWVLGNLLCKNIPPPDANLREEIANASQGLPEGATVREIVEYHRTLGSSCMGCHEQIDPIGLGLENFDAFGKWRNNYSPGNPVESFGELDGTSFSNAKDLIRVISEREDFQSCVVEKLMNHAVARPLSAEDKLEAKWIAENANSLREAIVLIAISNAFLIPTREIQ